MDVFITHRCTVNKLMLMQMLILILLDYLIYIIFKLYLYYHNLRSSLHVKFNSDEFNSH